MLLQLNWWSGMMVEKGLPRQDEDPFNCSHMSIAFSGFCSLSKTQLQKKDRIKFSKVRVTNLVNNLSIINYDSDWIKWLS